MLLDGTLPSRFPAIPWLAIRGLGNVLRHEYGDVDATIIWVTLAEGDLSALLAVAETEFERLG